MQKSAPPLPSVQPTPPSPQQQLTATLEPTSPSTSHLAVARNDDDDVHPVSSSVNEKLSPIDPSIHRHPLPDSYQPRKDMNERATSQRSTTIPTNSVTTTTNTTTTTTTITTTSSSRRRLGSNKDTSKTKTSYVTDSDNHDDVTSDIVPSTGDVMPGFYDAVSGSSKRALSTIMQCDTPASHQLQPLDSEEAACATETFTCTSPAATRCSAEMQPSVTTTHVDDFEPKPTVHYDNGTYEKLNRNSQRLSVGSCGYTALRPQRDSVMTDVSYESIRRLTATRSRAALFITHNDDDNTSTLRSDYLHPM